MKDDDEEEENTFGVTRYPCMPSLVALQQMRNRLHLAFLGRKLMKWTMLASGRELRRLAIELDGVYKGFAEELRNAYIQLARSRYYHANLNEMVLEDIPKKAGAIVIPSTKSVSGVKLWQYVLEETEYKPYVHLGIGKGGQTILETKKAWLELLKHLITMMTLRTSFRMVEISNRAATKKFNVLSKLVIPRVNLSQRYIISELEEMEREDNFRLKRFKELKLKKAGGGEDEKNKKKCTVCKNCLTCCNCNNVDRENTVSDVSPTEKSSKSNKEISFNDNEDAVLYPKECNATEEKKLSDRDILKSEAGGDIIQIVCPNCQECLNVNKSAASVSILKKEIDLDSKECYSGVCGRQIGDDLPKSHCCSLNKLQSTEKERAFCQICKNKNDDFINVSQNSSAVSICCSLKNDADSEKSYPCLPTSNSNINEYPDGFILELRHTCDQCEQPMHLAIEESSNTSLCSKCRSQQIRMGNIKNNFNTDNSDLCAKCKEELLSKPCSCTSTMQSVNEVVQPEVSSLCSLCRVESKCNLQAIKSFNLRENKSICSSCIQQLQTKSSNSASCPCISEPNSNLKKVNSFQDNLCASCKEKSEIRIPCACSNDAIEDKVCGRDKNHNFGRKFDIMCINLNNSCIEAGYKKGIAAQKCSSHSEFNKNSNQNCHRCGVSIKKESMEQQSQSSCYVCGRPINKASTCVKDKNKVNDCSQKSASSPKFVQGASGTENQSNLKQNKSTLCMPLGKGLKVKLPPLQTSMNSNTSMQSKTGHKATHMACGSANSLLSYIEIECSRSNIQTEKKEGRMESCPNKNEINICGSHSEDGGEYYFKMKIVPRAECDASKGGTDIVHSFIELMKKQILPESKSKEHTYLNTISNKICQSKIDYCASQETPSMCNSSSVISQMSESNNKSSCTCKDETHEKDNYLITSKSSSLNKSQEEKTDFIPSKNLHTCSHVCSESSLQNQSCETNNNKFSCLCKDKNNNNNNYNYFTIDTININTQHNEKKEISKHSLNSHSSQSKANENSNEADKNNLCKVCRGQKQAKKCCSCEGKMQISCNDCRKNAGSEIKNYQFSFNEKKIDCCASKNIPTVSCSTNSLRSQCPETDKNKSTCTCIAKENENNDYNESKINTMVISTQKKNTQCTCTEQKAMPIHNCNEQTTQINTKEILKVTSENNCRLCNKKMEVKNNCDFNANRKTCSDFSSRKNQNKDTLSKSSHSKRNCVKCGSEFNPQRKNPATAALQSQKHDYEKLTNCTKCSSSRKVYQSACPIHSSKKSNSSPILSTCSHFQEKDSNKMSASGCKYSSLLNLESQKSPGGKSQSCEKSNTSLLESNCLRCREKDNEMSTHGCKCSSITKTESQKTRGCQSQSSTKSSTSPNEYKCSRCQDKYIEKSSQGCKCSSITKTETQKTPGCQSQPFKKSNASPSGSNCSRCSGKKVENFTHGCKCSSITKTESQKTPGCQSQSSKKSNTSPNEYKCSRCHEKYIEKSSQGCKCSSITKTETQKTPGCQSQSSKKSNTSPNEYKCSRCHEKYIEKSSQGCKCSSITKTESQKTPGCQSQSSKKSNASPSESNCSRCSGKKVENLTHGCKCSSITKTESQKTPGCQSQSSKNSNASPSESNCSRCSGKKVENLTHGCKCSSITKTESQKTPSCQSQSSKKSNTSPNEYKCSSCQEKYINKSPQGCKCSSKEKEEYKRAPGCQSLSSEKSKASPNQSNCSRCQEKGIEKSTQYCKCSSIRKEETQSATGCQSISSKKQLSAIQSNCSRCQQTDIKKSTSGCKCSQTAKVKFQNHTDYQNQPLEKSCPLHQKESACNCTSTKKMENRIDTSSKTDCSCKDSEMFTNTYSYTSTCKSDKYSSKTAKSDESCRCSSSLKLRVSDECASSGHSSKLSRDSSVKSFGSCCDSQTKDASTQTRRSDRYDVRDLQMLTFLRDARKVTCTCRSEPIIRNPTSKPIYRSKSNHSDYVCLKHLEID
ncbi:putative uncharacterized protein DDB_G0282133 isoform X2 [Leptidea sinapis]|uniref:putative uncharacterized protein DDB_G0282133 isoform X2 n=1 Tax=Leptidea sinapis TaxID=189913 RepID=UPI0021C4379B|nr:putative uncharacterized protein DDB_G0282133 isoform X2 [Leptidea sinapis]